MSDSTPRFRLQLLGDLAIYDRAGTRIGEARRKPLAVLAYLAAEAPRAVNREQLAALLWPETTPERARRALAQTLYALRRELGADVVQGVSQLALDAGLVENDLAAFRKALARKDLATAAAHYGGPFLDGMYVAGAVEFERWAEGWRERVERMAAGLVPVHPMSFVGDPVIPRTAAPTHAMAPALPPRRRWPAFAARAAMLAAIVGTFAAAVYRHAPRQPLPPAPAQGVSLPSTIRARWMTDRRARVDSSHIGRILLLPTQVLGRGAEADTLAWEVQSVVRAGAAQTFTGLVDQDVARRVEAQVLQETARWSTTTTLQIARMMALTGAQLAIRPMLSMNGDSSYVRYTYYRSTAGTPEATRGSANLDATMPVAVPIQLARRGMTLSRLRMDMQHFVRSMERCDPDLHADFGDAPWCWSAGRRLIIPEGSYYWRWRQRWEQYRKAKQPRS
jgi:hypothetical protein